MRSLLFYILPVAMVAGVCWVIYRLRKDRVAERTSDMIAEWEASTGLKWGERIPGDW